MGFFDKITGFFKRLKEENKYLVRATARINSNNLYGWVNYKVGKLDPNDDFRGGSYVNIENGKGLIYSTGTEDYFFEAGDIVSFNILGDGQPLNGPQDRNTGRVTKIPTVRFAVEFKDGKKTTMDINCQKLDVFKSVFQL